MPEYCAKLEIKRKGEVYKYFNYRRSRFKRRKYTRAFLKKKAENIVDRTIEEAFQKK